MIRTFNLAPVLFLLLLIVGCDSCWSAEEEVATQARLDQKIRVAARDGAISAEECQALYDYYVAIPDAEPMDAGGWADLLGGSKDANGATPTLDCAAITYLGPAPPPPPPPPGCPATPQRLNLYVENSWSMYPYLKTGFEMRKVIMEMPRRVADANQNIRVYLKNNETKALADLPGAYAGRTGTLNTIKQLDECLTQEKLRNLGDPRNSRLVDLLNDLVQETIGDCEPRMVFSDFIYSLNGNGNMQQEMKEVTTQVGTVFGDASRNGLATLMIKFSGQHDGIYYSSDRAKPKFTWREDRPYYAWVIGSPPYLKTFVSTYNITTLPGYRNHAIVGPDLAADPAYTILPYTLQNRREPCRYSGGKNQVVKHLTYCDDDKYPEAPGIAYVLGANLRDEILPDTYLSAPENYRIDGGSSEDGWRVTAVTGPESIDDKDKGRLGTITHLLHLQAGKLGQRVTNLQIKLLDQRPAWLEASHTESDSETEMPGLGEKTFGYQYLVDGVWAAYRPGAGEKTVFNLPITLEK